jgi:alpha-glucosidase (family GH31 glycosyl hydrolase)
MNDQFMAGSDILVAPVLAEGRTRRKVYLPAGEWYDFWTGKRFKGGTTIDAQAPLETVPLYVRAGAVVPFWPEMKHTGEIPVPPVTFKIYPDENGAASGVLYEDDGETTGYASGIYRRTRVKVTGGAGAIRIETACEGSYAPAGALWSFEIEARKVSAAELDGRPLPAGALKREDGRAAVTIAADGRPHVLVLR